MSAAYYLAIFGFAAISFIIGGVIGDMNAEGRGKNENQM